MWQVVMQKDRRLSEMSSIAADYRILVEELREWNRILEAFKDGVKVGYLCPPRNQNGDANSKRCQSMTDKVSDN